MTMIQWEYASVIWTDELRKVEPSDPDWAKLPEEKRREAERNSWRFLWWRDQQYSILVPGAEEDIRPAWSTGDHGYRVRMVDVLNELGAEGWELVSHVVRGSSMGQSLGHETTGYPIQIQWLLKRPAS